MHRTPPIILALVAACAPPAPAPEGASTSTTDPTTSTTEFTTTNPTTTTLGLTTSTTIPPTTDILATSTGDASTTLDADSFIVPSDAGCESSGCIECDPFTQDCAVGEKCMPWAQGGATHWNATKCVPVTGDGQAGDPCTAVESGTSGLDDCALGHMCWSLDAALNGECVALCSGSLRSPQCPENSNTSCSLTSDGVISLCLEQCDPVLANCPGRDLCLPVGLTFQCMLDASGDEGQFGDPCDSLNTCDPGLLCFNSAAASSACDLDKIGCCSPFCEFPNGPCPGPDQQCLQWYEPPIPPGSEHIGVCAIPR